MARIRSWLRFCNQMHKIHALISPRTRRFLRLKQSCS
jgi:hypothetical protein